MATVNRLQLAKQFVNEMLEKRDDIVGAIVAGSVCRGEETETSDIDLALFVKGIARFDTSLQTWRDGVFVEAALVPFEPYSDFNSVMKSPFRATHVNDSLILFDRTGALGDIQQRVRALFMEPKWVALRVLPWLAVGRTAVGGFRDAVAAGLPYAMCAETTRITFFLASVALLRSGVTPSSTRPLSQLEKLNPGIAEEMAALHCSLHIGPKEVQNLTGFYGQTVHLADVSAQGLLMEYFRKKVEHMAPHDVPRHAISLLWGVWGFVAHPDKASPEVQEEAEVVAKEWLRAVGWVGEAMLPEKVRLAESIPAKVEALVADLPAMDQVGA